MELVIEALTDEHNGIIESLEDIAGVGHRVVHGGEKYAAERGYRFEALDRRRSKRTSSSLPSTIRRT